MMLNINTLKKGILFVLLFLASMNFQAKFFYYVFGSFLLMILFQPKIRIDIISLIYTALGLLMAFYNADEGIMSVIRCFAPCCFYIVGLNIVTEILNDDLGSRSLTDAQSTGYAVLIAISMGSFSHFTINYIYNFGKSIGRNTNDIWTGLPMAATGQIALICLMAGLSIATLLLPKQRWNRLVATGALVVILLYNFVLAGRSILVILIALLVVGAVYLRRIKRWGWLKLGNIIKILAVIALMIVIYAMDVGGIQAYIQSSELFERISENQGNFFDNSLRNNAKWMFMIHMIEYPFGGLHLRASYGYAHDLLLDGYDEYGVIVLGLMIVIIVNGLIQLVKIMRNPAYDDHFKLALLLVNVAVFLEFMLEPILEGMPWLFSCYCLINGCMSGMNQTNEYMYQKKQAINK